MRNVSKRIAGVLEETTGRINNEAGKLMGNKPMPGEGKARELKGEAKVQLATAADRVKVIV